MAVVAEEVEPLVRIEQQLIAAVTLENAHAANEGEIKIQFLEILYSIILPSNVRCSTALRRKYHRHTWCPIPERSPPIFERRICVDQKQIFGFSLSVRRLDSNASAELESF